MKHIDELKEALTVEFCDIEFFFKDKPCGVTPIVKAGKATYDVWYGDDFEEHSSADGVLNTPLFDGKTLAQIAEDVDFFYV